MRHKTQPRLHEVYTDYVGRQLLIQDVLPQDPRGREVQGRLFREDQAPKPYACTLLHWAQVWRDKEPPTPPSEQASL